MAPTVTTRGHRFSNARLGLLTFCAALAAAASSTRHTNTPNTCQKSCRSSFIVAWGHRDRSSGRKGPGWRSGRKGLGEGDSSSNSISSSSISSSSRSVWNRAASSVSAALNVRGIGSPGGHNNLQHGGRAPRAPPGSHQTAPLQAAADGGISVAVMPHPGEVALLERPAQTDVTSHDDDIQWGGLSYPDSAYWVEYGSLPVTRAQPAMAIAAQGRQLHTQASALSRVVLPVREGLERILKAYTRLIEKHYHLVSFVQGTVLGLAGDCIAQMVEAASRGVSPLGFTYNLQRTVNVGILAAMIDGLATPRFYDMMEALSPKTNFLTVMLKLFIALTIYGPLSNGVFLAGVPLLERGLLDFGLWRKQLCAVTVRDVQMWSLFYPVNFIAVPKPLRPLANSLMSLVFLVLLSVTAYQAS